MSAMENLLKHLLETSDMGPDSKRGPVCPVQIEFKGLSIPTPQGDPNMASGILCASEVEGIFCIGSASPALADMPGGINKGDIVLIDTYFEPESVRRVIRAQPQQNSPIIVPGHA